MVKKRADYHPFTPAAEAALKRSLVRIQAGLDKASPRIRNQLDGLSDELARRLDHFGPGLRDGLGKAGVKASREAGMAGRKVRGNLAATVEYLADELARAPVPAGVEGFLGAVTGNRRAVKDGQKAIVRAARLASKELHRSASRSGKGRNVKVVACLLAAAVVAAVLIRRATRHFPEPKPAQAAPAEADPGNDSGAAAGESPADS
ncbi:hypothetical protein [Pseudarthrobacter sp. N5]|uniref:hypothetical protein n=1 Tax=Pseudarthrobacter sp. N5 TaxID=3418416 RepID=UPI003CE9C5E9